jgi:hypothetical protein
MELLYDTDIAGLQYENKHSSIQKYENLVIQTKSLKLVIAR